MAKGVGTTGLRPDASREASRRPKPKALWRAAASRSPWRLSPAATPRVRWLFPAKASDGVFGETRQAGSGARGGAPRGGDGSRVVSGVLSRRFASAAANQPSSTRSSPKRDSCSSWRRLFSSVPKTRSCRTEIALTIPRRNANRTRSYKKRKQKRAPGGRLARLAAATSGRSACALRSPPAPRSRT